jgi:hypothetical protein
LHRQSCADVAVADFVHLHHPPRLPYERDGAGQQPGVDSLTDGRLVAVEIHAAQASQDREDAAAVVGFPQFDIL